MMYYSIFVFACRSIFAGAAAKFIPAVIFCFDPAIKFGLAYYAASFSLITLWLLFQVYRIANSDDESLKGKVLLKGMVWHFIYSLIILIVYWQFYYHLNVGEVWIALAAYAISFVIYITAALRVK